MGSSISSVKENLYNSLAFPAPPCSYDINLPNLNIVNINNMYIPILHIKDKSYKYTLLYSHGNGCDIGIMSDTLKYLSKACKINIVAYDYPKYGMNISDSKTTENNVYDTISAVYDYITKREKINKDNLILYGVSIGTGPTCYLASMLNKNNINIHSVIIQAGYTSVSAVVSTSIACRYYCSLLWFICNHWAYYRYI